MRVRWRTHSQCKSRSKVVKVSNTVALKYNASCCALDSLQIYSTDSLECLHVTHYNSPSLNGHY